MTPFAPPPLPDPPGRDWRPLLFNLAVIGAALGLVLLVAWWLEDPAITWLFPPTPPPATATLTPPTATSRPPSPLPAGRPAPTAHPPLPPPLPPSPTSTRVVPLGPDLAATAQAGQTATAQAAESARALALLQQLAPAAPAVPASQAGSRPVSHTRASRLVLAHYFAWYDEGTWDDCNLSAGDRPLQPYNSDDPAAISRHIELARRANLDGFSLHWFVPDDRTDRNFAALLALSQGQPFFSTIVFSRHIWPGQPPASQKSIAGALGYILERYGAQPNFLTLEGKPVILFTDVYRVPAGLNPMQFWAAVRAGVDPDRRSWWIAEGLDAGYLEVFDGLYVFKITHATSLNDYVKASRWAGRVREWEQRSGAPKLWLGTISPGWDDLAAGCKPDVRVPNPLHRRDREDGALYRATFEAALASRPDWLILSSFNEWVEGSYIEPGQLYGDKYIQLTAELAGQFKGQ